MWARGRVVTKQCPKSLITAQSLHYLKLYRLWRSWGKGCLLQLDAKSAEAIELLEEESKAEQAHEE